MDKSAWEITNRQTDQIGVDGYKVSLEIYTSGVGDVAGRYKVVIKDTSGVVVDSIDDVSFDKRADRYISNVINPGTTILGKSDLLISIMIRL
jgi:hypothetical protein